MIPEKRFEENMPLVGFVLQKHFKQYLGSSCHEDLMQEGYLALWRSCQKFDEDLGYQFSSYATNSIRYAMLNYLRKENKVREKLVSIYEVVADNGEGEELRIVDTLFVMPEDGATENLLEYCIRQLEEFDQVIVKVLLKDHTQQETAEICRTSQATVSRCLAKLRKTVLGELKK